MSQRAASVARSASATATSPTPVARARTAPGDARADGGVREDGAREDRIGRAERTGAEVAPPPPIVPVRPLRPDEPPQLDFSRIANHGARIEDADAARARLTRMLLMELAPALGLDLSRVRITVTPAGGARIEARGASALQDGDEVLLHPSRYRPQSDRGRYLLAHELAHAAQRSLTGMPIRRDPDAQARAAEAEAVLLGEDVVARRTPQRPKVALRTIRVAADTGEAAQPVPPIVESVKTSRSRELAIIKGALGGWWVSDDDVFTVMRILDTVSFPVAVAMVSALDSDERYWLADNINPPHMYRHRRSVLAAYQALEPGRFDAIDLKVLRALPDRGLELDETEAAVYTLKHLSRGDLDELLASEKGDAIARLIGTPDLNPEQAKRRVAAEKLAAKEEADLAKKRERIVALQKDEGVEAIVDAVSRQLSAPRDDQGEPRLPHGGDAVAVVELLARHTADQNRFLAIAEGMQAKGLIDTLLELMPSDRFFDADKPHYTDVLIGLVQSRLPITNEQLLEDLLSYGLFDWAIRDYEALFAYRLIKLMPMAAQYRFRQRDGGKWYLRLLDNLPSDPDTGLPRSGLEIRKAESREELDRMRALGATTEVVKQDALHEKDEYYYNASEIYEKKLLDAGAQQALQDLLEEFAKARKGIFRDAEAIALYAKVVALGRGTLERGKESPGDDLLREAVIRELDRHGCIEELFGQVPNDFLFAEENRVSTVKIMLSRDSMHVQAHARDLVSYGFTDWMVKDNEAYLAYLCVKALPAEERTAFIAANPDQWSRIQSELHPDARQARDLNFYVGDKAGTDRASVLAQLADAKNWTAENAKVLDSLLRMAMAMTEHRFAFERSQEFKAVDVEALQPLVEKYKLWNPAQGREGYRPEDLRQTRWHEEGLVQSLKSLWGGLVTLWRTDILFVDGKIGAKIDLNDVQDFMGGDLMGARLADPAKRGSRQPGNEQGGVTQDANKLTLLLDPAWFEGKGKSAELILPQLLIESTNVQTDGTTVQTGEVDLRALHIRAAYDDQNQGQPAQAQVTLDSLVVNDLLIAKSSKMYTLTRLMVSTLRLAAGTIDTTTGAPPAVRKGRYIPFPLLVLMMLPWLAQMAMVAMMAIPIKRIGKLADQGLEPDSRFQQDMLSRTKAIDISVGQIKAEGFSTSGGQHVDHVQVDDIAMRVGLNKATRLRAELASIDDRLKNIADTSENAGRREELTKRRAELQSQEADVRAQEQEYVAIQRRIHAGGLKPDEQKALQTRLDALDFEDSGGAFLDIRHIEASGISGTVTSRDKIQLDNVHGQGGSSALLGLVSGPTATPDELARRAQAGERPPPLISKDRPGTFTLELGDVSTGRLEVGGGVRGVADIDKQLEDLAGFEGRPEMQPLIESLQMLRVKAQRYEAMVGYGLSSLSPTELDEFRELRRVLTADAALIVESIQMTRAKLDVDLASGRIDLGADRLRIAGLQLPQKGIEVEEIVASGVRAGALPANGLLDWSEWKKHLRDADGGIDALEIRNARSKYHGLLFEKATLTGAYASVKQRGNEIELGLKHLGVEGLGLVPRLGLLNQRLSGLRQKARVADAGEKEALEKEIGELSTRIDHLQSLADSRLAAFMRLEHAKTPEEIEAAKKAVAEVDAMIVIDFKQYGAAIAELDDFGVKATGAGDLLSDALGGGIDPLSVLERGGVTVVGTGGEEGEKRLFRKLSVRGMESTGEDGAKHLSADAGAFEVENAKLDLNAKKEGDTITVKVPKFEIGSVNIDRFLMTSLDGGAGYQLWSRGASSIENIHFDGEVTLASRVPKSRDLSDYRLKHVRIGTFEIGRIAGNGLGFAMLEKKIEVDIESGSISGLRGTGVDVELPEDAKSSMQVTGRVEVDSIDQLVIGRAMMDTWSADGTINATAIGVDLLEDGGIKATIGDLDLTDFGVRGPDGWVRLNLKDLRGKLGWKDGTLDIEQFDFGSLTLKAIHWKVGEKGFVEASKPTTLTGFSMKGKVETRQVPAKAKPGKATKPGEMEREIAKVRIDSLHVDKVDSQHLIYQDEKHRVELRDADPTFERDMRGFRPLYLENLDVKGLDWVPGTGVTKGKVDIGVYETNAHYEGLKSGLLAGIALTGKSMSVDVVGPGTYNIDPGKIEKTAGNVHTANFDTNFSTGAIVGKVSLGPDFVELQNVEIDKTMLTGVRYRDLPKILQLNTVGVEKIKLAKVRQNYTPSTDPETKGEMIPTTLQVRDLELFNVHATSLDYKGESRGMVDVKGVMTEEVATQHIRGQSVDISHLKVEAFDKDSTTGESSLSAKVDVAPGAKKGTQPFGIKGLGVELISTIGSEKTKKEFTSDVEGGPLTASGIKFKTVVLGEAPGPGGKMVDVTRTQIDGSFELTRLGLLNPDLTLTDAKGKTVRMRSKDYASGSIEIAGIRPKFMPNGTVALPIDSVIAKNMRLIKGDMTVDLPLLEIKDIVVGLRGMGTEKGMEWLAASIGKIHVQGLSVEVVKRHKAELSEAEFIEAKKEYEEAKKDAAENPPGTFIAQPLAGLQGSADGEYSLDNWEDPDVTPKIENGVVEFGGMTNYAVQLHTVDDGNGGKKDVIELGNGVSVKTLKDFGRKMPGFYGDEGKYWYGKINLKEMVEGLANEPGSPPQRTYEAAESLRNFYGFSGEFILGNGRIGWDKGGDGALGDGDDWIDVQRLDPSQNKLNMTDSNLGNQINLDMPVFRAGSAGFTAGKTQDGTVRKGSTGEIKFEQIDIRIKGLASMTMTVTLEVKDGTILDVRIGDLTFIDPTELAKLKAPELTDVNPKGVPKAPPTGGP